MSKKVTLDALNQEDEIVSLNQTLARETKHEGPSEITLLLTRESELISSTGSYNSNSSMQQRRKEAAGGALGQLADDDKDAEELVLDDSWVTVDLHKRELHPTT